MTWIKFCSMKNEDDIAIALKVKPDAVGFLVGQQHKSSDFISPQKARELSQLLPTSITPVLVTHMSRPEDISLLVSETDIKTLQLHGGSTVEQVIELRKLLPCDSKLIYAVHINDDVVPEIIDSIIAHIDMLLLDSCINSEDRVGGTGVVHDWGISANIVKSYGIPIILAGGLTPGNVVNAIEYVHPYGVDVNSGVKDNNGFRSLSLCSKFVINVKNI